MITGMHLMLYSRHAKAVQAFLHDVLGLQSVNAGDDWPIFAAPPAEIAVHETDDEPGHEIFLMCDDVEAMVAKLAARGIATENGIADRGWGRMTALLLPGGERMGLYEPRHPSPISATHASAGKS